MSFSISLGIEYLSYIIWGSFFLDSLEKKNKLSQEYKKISEIEEISPSILLYKIKKDRNFKSVQNL